jgi:prepilin-type processing-associated H-X9-DG protein
LIVVVAVVGMLLALSVPVIGKVLAKSRQTACLAHLHQIGIGLQAFLQDNDGELPEMQAMRLSKSDEVPVMDTVLLSYVGGDPSIFHCPADQNLWKNSGSSYWYYETVTLKPNGTRNYKSITLESFFLSTGDPAKIPLILDKESFHPGPNKVNALYADGHVGPLVPAIPK